MWRYADRQICWKHTSRNFRKIPQRPFGLYESIVSIYKQVFFSLVLKKKRTSLAERICLLFCNEIMLHTELPCITIHPLPAAELCSNTWRITRRESDCYLLSLLRMSELIPQLISTRCSADANCTTAHNTMRRDVKALKMYHTQQRMFSSR